MFRFRKYMQKHTWMYVAAVIVVFAESNLELMLPALMSRIIDEGIRQGDLDLVVAVGSRMLLVAGAGILCVVARNFFSSIAAQCFGAALRLDVFNKILQLSEPSVDRLGSGSLVTRMTNDTEQLTNFLMRSMRMFIKAPTLSIGSIIFAMQLNLQLSTVVGAVVAVVACLIVLSLKMSYPRFRRVQKAIDNLNTTVQEFLAGVRLVKVFGREKDEREKFAAINAELAGSSLQAQLVSVLFYPLMSFTIQLGMVGVFILAGFILPAGTVEVGKISAFISYMTQLLTSLVVLTDMFRITVRARTSAERIMEVLDSENEPGLAPGGLQETDSESKAEVKDGPAVLEFRHVSFTYPQGSGSPVISDVSFALEQGRTLAVIGPTGSGKTTLAWLALRLYDPQQGEVLLNGRDLRTLDYRAIRRDIAIAPQQSSLFSGSVLENLQWGKAGAPLAECRQAAAEASAEDFILAMPHQYESLIGQGGVQLSGGQRQRISIARALVRNSPVLILDDSTSALDAQTEARVLEAIGQRTGRQAVLLVTQRISTARRADRILVLENGVVAGLGSHDELLSACAVYRDICTSQLGVKEVKNDGTS